MFSVGVNFVEKKNIKITKITNFMSFSFIYLIFLFNKTHFNIILTNIYAILINIGLFLMGSVNVCHKDTY